MGRLRSLILAIAAGHPVTGLVQEIFPRHPVNVLSQATTSGSPLKRRNWKYTDMIIIPSCVRGAINLGYCRAWFPIWQGREEENALNAWCRLKRVGDAKHGTSILSIQRVMLSGSSAEVD